MKKTFYLIFIMAIMFITIPVSYAGGTHSGQASQNGIQASAAGSRSMAHSAAGSAQAASAIIAVPLIVAGSVGSVSLHVGEELWEAATSPAGSPLEVSDEIVTAGPPPDKVLKTKDF